MAKRRRGIKRAFRIRRKFGIKEIFSPVIKILQLIFQAITKNIHFIILAIILILIAKGIYDTLLNSDYFAVKEVQMLRMEEDAGIADSSVSLQLQEGVNIFKLNLKKCQRQIEEAHPEIKNVKVNRILPDKIVVYFEKRTPVCQVKSSRYYLVSNDAIVLPNPENYARAGLPVVNGIYISESRLPKNRKLDSAAMYKALQLIQQIENTDFAKKYKIAEIDVYDESNPIICLENGIQIKVGRTNFIKKEPALDEVLKDLESKGLRPKCIDLRFEDIVVTPR